MSSKTGLAALASYVRSLPHAIMALWLMAFSVASLAPGDISPSGAAIGLVFGAVYAIPAIAFSAAATLISLHRRPGAWLALLFSGLDVLVICTALTTVRGWGPGSPLQAGSIALDVVIVVAVAIAWKDVATPPGQPPKGASTGADAEQAGQGVRLERGPVRGQNGRSRREG